MAVREDSFRRPPFGPFIVGPAGYNECVTRSIITTSDDTPMSKLSPPLLALIASAIDKVLAKYIAGKVTLTDSNGGLILCFFSRNGKNEIHRQCQLD